MKKFYQITLSILFVFAGLSSFAQSGIYESYAILSINGGANAYYDMQATTGNPDFQGANLGSFNASNSLTLKGGENKTFKCSPCDITNGSLWYRVYPTGSPSGSFNQISYFFGANLGSGCGGNDQSWNATGSTINLLSGLSPGNYTVEVYSTANYQGCGTGTHYSSNSGNNYKATFTYCGPTTGALPAGTYSIPGCFATVNDAATYISTNGVSGAVIFNVAAGHTETAPVRGIQLGTITGTSATNTVKFQKSGSGANPTITAFTPQTSGAKMDAVIRFVGADFVTFDGFTLQENASNTTIAAATNNMTEFGVGFFGATATNGSQNNTIQNCTISMGSTYPSATGIFSTSTLSTADVGTTAQAASSAAGLHSNNKFYSNTVSNVNHGFIFICPTQTTALQESGIEIGGSAAGTGNTVTFGLATGVSQTAGWTAVGTGVNGIMLNSPSAVSIQSNTLTSTITSNTATDHTAILIRGTVPSSGTYTRTISNNTITLNNSATTLVSNGIDFGNGRASGTLDASNNTITINKTSGAANSRAITGIIAGYAAAGITIAGNTINLNTSISVGSYTGAITGITVAQAFGTAGITVDINSSNSIKINQSVSGTGSYGSGAITYINAAYTASTGTGITVNVANNSLNTTSSTIRSTGALVGINCEATVGLYNIKSNTFNVDRVAASGSVNFTFQTTTPANVADTISSNTITLTSLAGTTSVNAISQLGGPSTPSNGNKSVCNNIIDISGACSGTINAISFGYTTGSFLRGNSITVSSASPTIIGFLTGAGYSATNAHTISSNSFSLTSSAASGTELTAIKVSVAGNANVFGNTISNLSFTAAATSAPAINGIWVSVGQNNIYQNSISGLSFTGTSGGPSIRGIYVSGGTTNVIYKNKVYGLTAVSTGNTALYGVALTGGTTNSVYNNLIGGLSMTTGQNSNGSPMSGIFASGGTTNNIFNNTVYITGTTSGSLFYSAGLYTSTTSTTVDVRSNIIVNTCSPVGAGAKAAAFYRSGTALTNLASTCNNNFYFAGTPSASNCIYFDVTNTDQTIAGYKTRVGTTREAASFTENFNPATYFVSTTGSNAGFLHMAAALSTQIESGGTAVSTPVNITDDYDGQTRPGGGGTTNGGGTAPDVGADEFDGAPVDLTAPTISFTALTNSCSTGDLTLSGVTIVDATGVPTTGLLKPRIYFRKNSGTWYSNAGTLSSGTATNGTWSFVISEATMGGITGGDVIQYYVIAQDLAAANNITSNPSAGLVATNVNTVTTNPSTPSSVTILYTLNGTYSVGSSQSAPFNTLTAAVNLYNTACISGPVVYSLTDATYSGSETFPIAINSNIYQSSTNTFTIRPAASTAVSITGAPAAGSPLIDLNGADYVTIDGINSGGASLTISNTSTSATANTSTIRFINGATNNTVTKAFIQGSGTVPTATEGGTIFFSTDATTTNGNDNNTISFCDIGPAGSNLPSKAINGVGSTTTTAIGNSGIIIDNNNIFDYFNNLVGSAGVYTNAGCNTWTITNNKFYQTGTRTFGSAVQNSAIWLLSSTATSGMQGATITGNTIGFASSAGTGTYTLLGGSFGAKFVGIFYNGIGTGTLTTINNNTIAGVSLTGATSSGTTNSSPFCGILINTGLVTSNSNTIGSQSATGSLVFTTNSTAGTHVMGIYNHSSDDWTSNNNTVGGLTITNAGASGAFNVYGLVNNTAAAKTWTANSNTVGGSVTNSILNSCSSTSSLVYGIYNNLGIMSVSTNTVRNLSATAGSISGIANNSSAATTSIQNNTISALSSSTAAGFVAGIQSLAGTAVTINKNKISDLNSNGTTSVVSGVAISAGTTTNITNNLIGDLRSPNGSNTTTDVIRGINLTSTTTFSAINVYYNSIYLAASGGTNFTTSGVFHTTSATATTAALNMRNNIVVNNSAPSGSGLTIAYRRSSATLTNYATTSNNNLFFTGTPSASRLIFYDGTNSDQTLAAFKTRMSTRDQASVSENPSFLSTVSTNANFLKINTTIASQVESGAVNIATYTDDFENDVRQGNPGYVAQVNGGGTAPDIGADEFDGTPSDITAPSISFTDLTNDGCTTSNRTFQATITDGSGVDVTAGGRPRVYFKKSTNANVLPATNDNTTDGWKFVETASTSSPYTMTIDPTLFFGGLASGDVVQYFVVAEDLAAVPNVAIQSGTFAAAPSSVALTSAQFGITGTIKQYTIVPTLSGTVQVGPSQTYTSLTLASGGLFNAINTNGLSGNLVAEITGNISTETGAIALNQVSYACGAGPYTITIKPAASTSPTVSGTSSGTALIKLNGADYVTFDGSNNGSTSRNLTIQNNSTSTSSVVMWLASVTSPLNGATNNTIKNCIVLGNSPTTTVTVISQSGAVQAGIPTIANNNNTYENNLVRRGFVGIEVVGATGNETGLIIRNNTIGSATSGDRVQSDGIAFFQQQGAIVEGNTIAGVSTSSSSLIPNGIYVDGTISGGFIRNNTISNIRHTNTSGYAAAGIFLASSTANTNLTISNNFIFDVAAYGFASGASDNGYGLYILQGGGYKVYHNTIDMGTDQTVAGISAAVMIRSSGSPVPTNLDFRNNIFVNRQTTGTRTAILCQTGTSPFSTINNNNYYTSGTNLAFINSANASNLAALQTATGQDANSVSVLPNFTSSTDLHLVVGNNSSLNNAGAIGTGISSDFDGDVRCPGVGCPGSTSNPDIGADEFTPPVDDAGLSAAAGSLCPGSQPVTVTLTNGGLATLTSVTINWSINGVAQTPYSWTGSLASTATSVVTLGNFTFVASTNYVLVATAINPNGNSDNNTANDTYTSPTFQTGLSGTYTVGTAGNFSTITAAVAAANTYGLCGATVFSLTDATYSTSETFPITINQLVGSSSTNTLTIKPASGVTATISGSNTTALVILNGADYITVDGSNNGSSSRNLTITNTSTNSSSLIVKINSVVASSTGATNNTFKNIILTGSGRNNTFAAIYQGGATVPSAADIANNNNTYTNNLITACQDGILAIGLAAGTETGLVISNNTLGHASTNASRIAYDALFVSNQSNFTVSGNTVLGVQGALAGNIEAIMIGGASSNGLVSKNLVTYVTNTSISNYSAAGITLTSSVASSNITVSNNMIYGVFANGDASNPYYNGHGILVNRGGGYNIYHNTIQLGTNQTNASVTAGIYINATSVVTTPVSSSLTIVNNIFSNVETTGTRYAIYSEAPSSAFTSINNNVYNSSGTNFGFLGSAQSTLAGWQGVTSQDANSLNVAPVFISTTNLRLNTSSNPALDGAGATGTGVTDDIDGDVRCPGGSCPGAATNPDPGADEFEVPTCLSPSAVTASNITATGVDIAWTAPSPAPSVGYEWLIVASGAGSGGTPIATTPAAGSVTGTSVTGITGLSASTTYDIWVRSDCGSSLYSPYVGPISFTTRPVNDECANAVSVTVNSSNVCTSTTTGTSVNASQSLVACAGSGTADDDVWYSFVASNTSHTVTLTPLTMNNANFQVFSGSCGSLTSLACINNTTGSTVETTGLTSLTIGTTYYIRVYSNGNGSGQGTFTLCVSSPPANDACANAIDLPCGTSGLAGSTDGAILETAPNGCASSYGVWYSFVGDGTTASITVGSSFDHEITVSSGTCSSLTNVSCVDNAGSGSNETATFATTSGTTYYLYVAHYLASSTTTGTITLTRASSIVLSNTGTPAAGNIPVGTTDAVISGFQLAPSCLSFDHTAVTFTTSGTATTSDLSNFRVYRDVNNNGTYQSGTDVLVSSSALALSASMVFTITGETGLSSSTRYLLVADVAGGATIGRTITASITAAGNVTVSTTPSVTMTGSATGNTQTISAAPPSNDLCSNATALPCGTSALAGTTVNTITETAPFGCASNFGVWYTFTGDGAATTIAVAPTGFDVEITLGSGSCGSLTQISCTDGAGSGSAETVTFNTVNGTTYYVYVAQFNPSSTTTGAFTISRTASLVLSNTGAPAAGNISQGASNVLISGFQLSPACATYDLTGVTFTTTGTATSSDLSNFRVYRDVNSNGTYEGGTDVLASTASQAFSTSIAFTITGQTSVSAAGRYLLVADVAAGATVGNTITASITSVSDITYSTSPSVTATGTATGNTRTISGTPPANDNCGGATAFPTIPTDGSCVTLSNQSTANATASGVTPTGSCASNLGTPDDDVWYSFVAPGSTVILNFTYVSGLTDIYWQAFSSACGSTMTSIACSDANGGGTLTGLTAGNTYFIRLYSYAASGSSVQNVCLQTPPPPPSNDNCSNATVVTCSTTGLAGTTVNTVAEAVTPPVCSGSISAFGVWYKFTGTGLTTNFTVTPATGYDVEVIAYSGTCGSLTALTCADNNGSGLAETASITAANGTDYYIYVAYYATGTSTGTFTLTVGCISPLTNNDCSSATAFPTIPTDGTCASLSNQSTSGATNSNVTPSGSCSSNFGNPDDDVWFSFVATSTQQIVEFTYVTGATDIYWQAFSGACGSTMTSIACSDVNSGGTLTGLTIGQTYYIRMYTYSAGVSTIQNICIKSPVPNDDCTGATLLTYCAAPVTGNILDASESSPFACGSSYYWYDLWYKFVADATTATIKVNGSSGFDAVAELHDACGGTVLYCRDNNGDGGTETINATGLTVGNTYYIRAYAYEDYYYSYPTTYTFTVAVTKPGYWTGATNTDWNTASNWCDNSVPTTTVDVTIPNQTNDPIVGAYTANCANFTILSGATFGFSGGVATSTLIINGSVPVITTNGNTFSGAGVLQIGAGSAIATITGGATFNNDRVTVSSNSNLKLNGSADFNIGRAIRVSSGASVYSFGSNNIGNYPSTPNATAYLHFTDDGVNNGIIDYNAGGANGFISGQVKSDRRIAASNTGYRYISAPLQGTISQWADDFSITGADGFVHTGTAFTNPWPTLWQYDESNTNPNMAYGWVSNTNGSNVLDRATGYAAVTPGGITLDLTGPLQVPTGIAAGTISKAVTSTSSGQPLSDGWNLIGNPYQAPLNFVSLRSSNSSLVAAFAYYWVSNGTYTGNYGSYNALTGVSANGGTQFVAPHQGFMVRANGNGNVSFNNGMTGNTTAYAFLKSEGPSPEMPILRLSIKENGLISDEVVVASVSEAKENVSNDPYDTDKFFNNEETKPELYLTESENGSNKLAVSTLPGLTNETVVPIGVSHVGVFNTVVTEMANIPTGVKVYLEDRKLDQQVELHLGDAVTLTKGDGEAAEGRYFLRFGNEDNAITAEEAQMIGYSYVDNGSIQIKLMDAGINPSEAKVMDISGKLIGNFQLTNNNGVNSISSVVLAPGVYLVDVKTDKGTFVNKLVVSGN